MAFDLNKPGVEKKKFDLSKSDESTSSNNFVDNSNSGNDNKKPSSWIFIVITIALIGGGIWYFSSKHGSDLAKDKSTAAVVPSDSTASQVSKAPNTTSAKVDSSKVSEQPAESKEAVKSNQAAVKPVVNNNSTEKVVKNTQPKVKPSVSSKSTEKVAESSQKAVNPSVSTESQASSLTESTIEEKAKQVLRGDFGNGIDRKNALGSEYKKIQKKVNEMCREAKL